MEERNEYGSNDSFLSLLPFFHITKGQPLGTTRAITKERIASLYAIDRSLPHRKSHENPVIQKLYERDLGAPLSPKAQDLLHTTYHEIPPAFTF